MSSFYYDAVHPTDEQRRTWALEKALEHSGDHASSTVVVSIAKEFEKYLKGGDDE